MAMREMKNSGIPWIGKIPKNWNLIKGKYILQYLQRPVLPNDKVITCFRDGEVTLRSNRREEGFTISEKEIGYQGIDIGDLVVHGMDGFAGSIGISDSRGKASPVLNVLNSSQDKKFLMYYLRSMAYNNVFLALSTGIRVRSCDLNWNKLANLPYAIPPIKEQHCISDYLDSKCAKIDSIKKNVESEIEVLEQYERSVITETVTKGLDKNVEMKDSGIPWIGEIPKDWKISRLKYVLKEPMKYGANESGIAYSDALPRYIRITDIDSEGKLKKDGKLSLSEDIAKNYILKDKSILFARSGATVGKAFFYRKEYGIAAFAGYLISAIIDKGKALPEWIYYYVNSSAYWEWINQIYTQSTIQNIGADKYSEMPVPICPNISLQKNILKLLDSKCSRINSVIQKKQELLANLDTYKKSLIYECVTGKKEVPAV